ncbi:hypothetical protein QFZ32_002069 [Streptomyces canus]|nr:hypothetical protein [Streptomyces canus]
MPMTWSYSACDLEQLREPAVGDDELEAAFGPGPGAIVVASHDRWLRRRRQGRELRLEPGRGRQKWVPYDLEPAVTRENRLKR